MKFPSGSSSRLSDRFLGLIENLPVSDRFLVRLAFFAVILTGIWLIFSLNQQYSTDVPVRGGSITEGIVGTPRFVNPALAITKADQDVTALVYSGLMRLSPTGELVNDLAEDISVSDDGLTYDITLRPNLTFHDGTPLTAHDVAFTIRLIQDPDLKSPLRGNWTDVTVEEVNDHELYITLKDPYAPFIENFTLGIMPAHIWQDLPIDQLPFSQLNTEPIGSGPFMITDANRDPSGIISHYTLTAYRANGDDSKIDSIQLAFYQNEDTLLTDLIEQKLDASAYVPPKKMDKVLQAGYRLIEEPLPRIFGIFFNQNHSAALRDDAARQALATAIDRSELIDETLNGHGVPSVTPIAEANTTLKSADSITDANATTTTPAHQAIEILENGGWIKNNIGLWEKQIDKETVTLSITLRTSNAPLFDSLVNKIAKQWSAIGVEVNTEQFDQSSLVQSVIRPRDYQALLFGLDMSRSYDLYPFWHSSQQDDPGLNVAQYANVEVDDLLETARTEQDSEARQEALRKASNIIVSEHPAIFLFQPTFTYVTSPNMTVAPMHNLGKASDRFSNVSEWHTESDSLWPFFQASM